MVLGKLKLVCKAIQFEAPLMLPMEENHLPRKDQQLRLMCLIGIVSKPGAKRIIFQSKDVEFIISLNIEQGFCFKFCAG